MTAAHVPNVDEALGQLATMLLHYPFDPTPEIHTYLRSETAKLDYSLESLATLQSYLSYMRTRKLSLAKRQAVILRTGAYLGEVIKRNWPQGELHWIDYKTANSLSPSRFPPGREGQFDMAAALYQAPGTYLLPLAQVGHMLVRAGGVPLVTWAQEALADAAAAVSAASVGETPAAAGAAAPAEAPAEAPAKARTKKAPAKAKPEASGE